MKRLKQTISVASSIATILAIVSFLYSISPPQIYFTILGLLEALFGIFLVIYFQNKIESNQYRKNFSVSSLNEEIPEKTVISLIDHFKFFIVKMINEEYSMVLLNDDTTKKYLTIYQFGSTSPKRKEYTTHTSNINILCMVENSQIQNKIITKLIDIEKHVSEKIKPYKLTIFTSYTEDKHSATSQNEIKMYVLIRLKNYLHDKSINQPLFILNIAKDYEIVYGNDYFNNINLDYVKSLLTYKSLVLGTGGIHEMLVFLSDSGTLIDRDLIAYIRSIKYTFIRSIQILILYSSGKHITKSKDMLILFEKSYLDELGFEFNDKNNIHFLLKILTEKQVELFLKKRTYEIKSIHNSAIKLINNIRKLLYKTEESRKTDYVSFKKLDLMISSIDNPLKRLQRLSKGYKKIIFITHALDDSVLCKTFFDNFNIQKDTNKYFTIFESPSLMKEFNVKGSNHLFKYFDDIFSLTKTQDEVLAMYIGSGTIYGNFLYSTINSLKDYIFKDMNNFSWGYVLLNVNPQRLETDVFIKQFQSTYSHIKPSLPPSIALQFDCESTQVQ